MLKVWSAPEARLSAGFLAFCLMAAAVATQAQNSQASPSASEHPASQAATKPNPDHELLAKASSLYYSTARAGLNSFSCEVHPDWRGIILSTQAGSAVAADDPRVVLLKSVKITLHGNPKGGSTIDWNPAPNPEKPLDEDSTKMLNAMRDGTNQILKGFLQAWAPFVDGSVIPADSEGLEITHTEKGHTIHGDVSGTSFTELLDDSLILQHFDVVSGGAIVNFVPTYKPTEKGLLISSFHAHIQPPGVQPDQAQEMNVEIDYQTLHGFPIPAKILVAIANTGTFNFTFDGCTVNQ
jgi:hypothetical protein